MSTGVFDIIAEAAIADAEARAAKQKSTNLKNQQLHAQMRSFKRKNSGGADLDNTNTKSTKLST